VPFEDVRNLGGSSWPQANNGQSHFINLCYFHFHRIHQVKRCLNDNVFVSMFKSSSCRDKTTAIVCWRVDQTRLCSFSRTLYGSLPHQRHSTSQSHHTFPHSNSTIQIQGRITLKICLLQFNIYSGYAPHYMSSLPNSVKAWPAISYMRWLHPITEGWLTDFVFFKRLIFPYRF